ncbi:hypothetical protein DS909_10700 [Phaeobacter gallaeciensis]|uniref:Type I restriction modification DNA specificity domain-containing protein n=1 Tax=Phaeobacter gallaeciensis TaxID=60890 RepID=A0A366X1K7_9RHOB|nr:restriction endonuclease subunit S [Phaeobacter gallaeciensis]RBW55567.1 hypothetical protein DS909_10700 [Phaeobacter gallaeciensis]
MKDGWIEASLGEVITLNYGKALARKDRNPDGGIPIYGANGVMGWSDHTLTEGPSIVVGRKGSAGEVTRVDGPFWPSDVTYFTSHDESRLDFGFMNYLLKSLNLPSMARGVKPGINRNDVYALKVPLPPLEEQQRIVAVLDEAFEGLARARTHAEANLADTVQIAARSLEVMLQEIGSRNGSVAIANIAAVKGGKRLPKGEKTSPNITPYPYISVKDFTEDGTVSTKKLGYISEEVQQSISRYIISRRDVYISIAGTIGKSGIVPSELEGANLTENAAKLVLERGWSNEYVYWCTRSSEFAKQASEQTRVAAQPKLALQRLGAIQIPKASEVEQTALCERMNSLRATRAELMDSYQKKLQDLDDLRQSLLQKAFAGELT